MADIAIPFGDSGWDILVTDSPANKIKYIAKSVEFSPDPAIMILRIKRALKRYKIDAKVFAEGDKITIQYGSELIHL